MPMELRQRSTQRGQSISDPQTSSSMNTKSSQNRKITSLLLLCTSFLGIAVPFLYSFSSNTSSSPSPSIKSQPFTSESQTSTYIPTPYCNLKTSDAIRAIRRAKTSQCRDEISFIACRAQNGTLYGNKSLKNQCPNKIDSQKVGMELGCFLDSVNQRILNEKFLKFNNDNSPKKCIEACTFYGFTFAGVQYKKECFCGNSLPKDTSEVSTCDLPCPKQEDGMCGGYLSMNIYHTGLIISNSKDDNNLSDLGEEENRPARIVFLLTLSGRSFRQVKRLIKRIYSPIHYYFIHVDSRQEYLHRELSVLESQNIKLVPNRFATIWGGSSLLQMLLSSMEDLLRNHYSWKWDFVLNLSESDYPLKPISTLTQFLSRNKGRNFVKSHGRDSSVFIQKQGLERTFYECENRMWRIGNRELPKGITLDGGSDWICLHKDFVSHIINNLEIDYQLSSLKLLYNFTLLPAESFFHTVLRNSEFCSTYINNNLHLTNWKRKLGCKCQHKAIVDWCGCSPNDITPLDWAKIKSSVGKNLYFVRKVEPIVSQSILDLIDSELLGISDIVDDRYWQNLYHYLDENDSKDLAGNNLAKSLIPNESHLKEITSFHKNDSFQGILILFNLNGQVNEYYIQPPSTSVNIELERSGFINFELGSVFDPKELIFRNFFKAYGNASKIGIKISYRTFENKSLTFIWIDPLGSVVKLIYSKLNSTMDISLPPLVQYEDLGFPDMAGLWKVIPLIDGTLTSGISFMVTSDGFHIKMDRKRSVDIPEILNNKSVSELIQSAFPNEEILHGHWTLNQTVDYYKLIDSCFGLHNCSSTYWSSLTNDSNSDLRLLI
ncbi:xylosyltransferase oxt [Lepeophtheirus salmonis]|uniref:xylosyltransferase oxt n=1 Tax=Lepeophtheirus salmonis TaxID=72036 RepID=UPI001AEA5DF6|nr:xylosyltransferase oxt-like [Lepeophtheirus salmonis]XP_040583032.1 xylosyltransferase oxt-like [Lepeophtheirus salmonis]XP_040583033.1 xylosyltransferase oxt-like [Lepeophtheirus salmonis]XP_040583034.1 xylosyltransferase oxt-like [Lepeophtheirus salmonis]